MPAPWMMLIFCAASRQVPIRVAHPLLARQRPRDTARPQTTSSKVTPADLNNGDTLSSRMDTNGLRRLGGLRKASIPLEPPQGSSFTRGGEIPPQMVTNLHLSRSEAHDTPFVVCEWRSPQTQAVKDYCGGAGLTMPVTWVPEFGRLCPPSPLPSPPSLPFPQTLKW